MDRLNKSYFIKQSLEEADSNRQYWLSKTPHERLVAAYRLSLRAWGHDPDDDPPSMDKSYFRKRKRV